MTQSNQQTNDLADVIVSAIGQYSNKKTATASYDKTYVSSIIGVNRNFMHDAKIYSTDIIDAMSIPEDDKRGILNYYTFRLHNGDFADKSNLSSIYCVKSEKRYYLGQPILVCIPNNDWSRMYISPLEPENRNIFYSAEEPTLGITKGDLWLQLDDDDAKNIVAIYECVYYEDADYNSSLNDAEDTDEDKSESEKDKDKETERSKKHTYGWKLIGQDKDQSYYPKLLVAETDPLEGQEEPKESWRQGDYLATIDLNDNDKLIALHYAAVVSEKYSDDGSIYQEVIWKKINSEIHMGTLKEMEDSDCPQGSYWVLKAGGRIGYLRFLTKDKDGKLEWAKIIDSNTINRCYIYTYNPELIDLSKNDNLWLQVNSNGKAQRLYKRVDGKWQFECEFGGDGGSNYIVSPEEPVIPETVNDGDCWTEYSISYNEEGKVVNTFTSLYMYNGGWNKAECTSGSDAPTSGEEDDIGKLFVKYDEDGIPVAVYRCEVVVNDKGKTEIQWVLIAGEEPSGGEDPESSGDNQGSEDDTPSEELSALYSYPYPPVNDGDRWVVIDSYDNRLASAVYKYYDSNWNLEYRFGGGDGNSYDTVVSVTAPVIVEPNKDDYWAEYTISYDNDNKEVNTFISLYLYNNKWRTIVAAFGENLPGTGESGDYFVKCGKDGIPTEVYRYIASEEGEAGWSLIVKSNTSKDEEDPENPEQVEQASEEDVTNVLYVYPYAPFKKTDRWVEIDNYKHKGAKAVYRYYDERWELEYKFESSGKSKKVIVSDTEPVIIEPLNGDYWAEYNIIYDSYHQAKPEFSKLYLYNGDWTVVQALYGSSFPSSATEGTIFVATNSYGLPQGVYRYELNDQGGTWVGIANNTNSNGVAKLYVYSYSPAAEGDEWLKVNTLEDMEARARYTCVSGEWVFNYKYSKNGEIFVSQDNPLTLPYYKNKVEVGDYWVQNGSHRNLEAVYIARINYNGELAFEVITMAAPVKLVISNAILIRSDDFVGDDFPNEYEV